MSADRAITQDIVSHTYPIRNHFLRLSIVQRLSDVAVKRAAGLSKSGLCWLSYERLVGIHLEGLGAEFSLFSLSSGIVVLLKGFRTDIHPVG